jgi:radical SAM superfamily enzyme YgiQ (UPF0313 family)
MEAREKRKIVLFYTMPTPDYWETVKYLPLSFPVGVFGIAGILKKAGYLPVIIDATVERDYLERLDREIDESVLYLGISTMTSGVPQGIEVSERVKKIHSSLPIVWGGVHPTIFPLETLADPVVDFVCVGEGEYVAKQLADRLRSGEGFEGIPGLGFKKNGTLSLNSGFCHLEDEELPPPDYSVIDMDKYLVRYTTPFTGEKDPARVVAIHGGRGCTYKCTFCISTLEAWGRRRDKKSAQLVNEVEEAITRFDAEIIYFQDDNFFSSRKRALDFFAGCRERGLKFRWIASAHSDYFNNEYLNDDFFQKYCVGPISCINIQIGVESASERIRKFIKKMARLDRVRQAAHLSKKYSVPMAFAFMVGIPTETRKEMLETANFMLELRALSPYAAATYQFYRPYPGAELYQLAIKMGYQTPQTLREWASYVVADTGFLPAGELPWIDDTTFLRKMIWCMTVLNVPEGMLPATYLPFYRLARQWILWRIRRNFWRVPIDFWILDTRFWKKGFLSLKNA